MIMGQSGGSSRCRLLARFAERLNVGFRCFPRIMGAGLKSSARRGPARGPISAPMTSGVAGGGRTPRFTRRCSSSRTIRVRRSRWRAAPCSTSSTPLRRRLSTSLDRPPANSTSVSAVARRSSATSSPPISSTASTSCWCRSSSAAVFACIWDGLEGIDERYDQRGRSPPPRVASSAVTFHADNRSCERGADQRRRSPKIEVPADRAWDAIRQFGRLEVWFPSMIECRIEGEGAGD